MDRNLNATLLTISSCCKILYSSHIYYIVMLLYEILLGSFQRKKLFPIDLKGFKWQFSFFCRLVLKCRSKARKQFAALRSDVLVKLELLDNKHFQDMVFQLKRLLDGLAKFHIHSQDIVSQEKLFPIECDFAPSLEEATNGPEETGFD